MVGRPYPALAAHPREHRGADRVAIGAIERTKAWAAGRGVSIRLVGDPDPHLLDDVDPAKAAAFPAEEVMAYREAIFMQQLRWTVVPAPNPGRAKEVFGEPDVERCEQRVLVPCWLGMASATGGQPE